MSINRVLISGNLTRDPEHRATAGGSSVLTFGVAVNDRRRNPQTGDWEDVPNFVDCVVFGNRADSLSRFLTKGTKVAIEGKLRYSSWEKDGQRRSKLEVIVDEVEFLTRQQNQGGYQNGGYQGQGGYQGGYQGQGGQGYGAPAMEGASYGAPAYGAPQGGYGNQGYQQAPAYSAPAPVAAAPAPSYGANDNAAGDAPSAVSQQTPPSADVYDEDIPF